MQWAAWRSDKAGLEPANNEDEDAFTTEVPDPHPHGKRPIPKVTTCEESVAFFHA